MPSTQYSAQQNGCGPSAQEPQPKQASDRTLPEQEETGWPKAAEILAAALIFAVFTAAALWPSSLNISGHFIGDSQGDFWKHSWGHWWVYENLCRGTVPLFCDLLNAPRGGYLFVADPCNSLLSCLLQPFFTLAESYNLLIIGNLWLGLMAAWFLACHFIKDRAACIVAAVIYGLSAYVLSYPVLSGVTETLNTAWVPLYILFLHRMLEKGRFSDLLCSALFFALTAFSCWYYGEFMAVYTAMALLKCIASRLREDKISSRLELKHFFSSERVRDALKHRLSVSLRKAAPDLLIKLRNTAAALLLGGLMILPFLAVFQISVHDAANIVMPKNAPKRSIFRLKEYLGADSNRSINIRGIHGFHNYTNILGWFLPGKDAATVTVTIDKLTRVHYLGWGALALAWAAWKKRRNTSDGLIYWTAAFIFFLILSLGPKATWSDYSSEGFLNPVYLAMLFSFPFFYNLAIPFRFLMLALISLGILAASGTQLILEGQPAGRRWFYGIFIASLVLLETITASPLPWPIPQSSDQTPEYYKILAADTRDYAVIDYPFERPGSKLLPSEYFYYQTVHRKKIPYRTSGILSSESINNVFMEELVRAQNKVKPSERSSRNIAEGAKKLRKMGFKSFIIHETLLSPEYARNIEGRLTPALGEPLRFQGGIVVYSFDSIKEISGTGGQN